MNRFVTRWILAVLLFSGGIALALLGVGDVNIITGLETFPDITQNHSVTWGHGDTIVIVYNDARGNTSSPRNNCAISVSTNGGETFTRLVSPFTGSGPCNGDGAVFYSRRASKWFASFSASSGCTDSIFGTGDGIRQWSSPDGINWTLGSCV